MFWQFWIDVGGTFTDCIGVSTDGTPRRIKVLSSGVTKGTVAAVLSQEGSQLVFETSASEVPKDFWRGYRLRVLAKNGEPLCSGSIVQFDDESHRFVAKIERSHKIVGGMVYELTAEEPAPILAMRLLLGLPLQAEFPRVEVRLGTTRGTNALLTRTGARTALVTTAGFGDALSIGYQHRPRLFELDIRKPLPLYERVIEIDERMSHDGGVILRLREENVRAQLCPLIDAGIESLAICLLHANRWPDHEARIAEIARALPFRNVSVSHEVSPLIKLVSRGQTTVLDAYLNPILNDYVKRIRRHLGDQSRLQLMTSTGGLVQADLFSGKDSLLSGPAGGVVGFARTAERAGFTQAIGFDMGGTSTDVSRFDGAFELEHESEKAGVQILAPQLAIETVAAGGGSICHFDGTRLQVGPQSASSDPGPACYGNGGPLAITDINLFLGRLRADRFPWRLNEAAVDQRLQEVVDAVAKATGQRRSKTEIAEGFLKVANLSMANTIRSISVARGYDVRDYTLCAFGGAASQHACAVADELKIKSVLVHPLASVLSAYGVGLATVERHRAIGVYRRLSPKVLDELHSRVKSLEVEARREVEQQSIPSETIRIERSIELRYLGTEASIELPYQDVESLETKFNQSHLRTFGYVQQRDLEIVALRVRAIGGGSKVIGFESRPADLHRDGSVDSSTMIERGESVSVQLLDREQLQEDESVLGPALIYEELSTIVVASHWQATLLRDGQILLESRVEKRESGSPQEPKAEINDQGASFERGTDQLSHDTADPILLEVFNKHFQSIATEMGETLRKTAVSVNVKERLDYSCALFSATGDLVVNAPHIPVHLGAMSETVKSLLARESSIRAGDIFVTNDPFAGGSHLPDVTVVTPVFDASGHELIFFTASRAHHAEIGGKSPGSMPPDSTCLAEEGVLLSNVRVASGAGEHFDDLERKLKSAPYPSRSPRENIAEIRAQMAANQKGANSLLELVERYSLRMVQQYMEHIQEAATQLVRQAIFKLGNGTRQWLDFMDDGSRIQVELQISNGSLQIDFAGSSDVHPGNLNANRSIVNAAVLYALRCLVDKDVPLNQGLLQAIQLNVPSGILNPPIGENAFDSPAVVGGNVETSQRIVDVLIGALDLAAASQGTMNNLLFGDESFGYYETICGGAGATRKGPGADAVHTHMTNTRLTDPEVLESRFPVRLRRFAIRRGSGGTGQFDGGDGVVRELEFLRPLQVTTLCQRRGEFPPFGMHGGRAGMIGENRLIRGGISEMLPGQATLRVEAGDRIIIETPGGGGWGQKGSE